MHTTTLRFSSASAVVLLLTGGCGSDEPGSALPAPPTDAQVDSVLEGGTDAIPDTAEAGENDAAADGADAAVVPCTPVLDGTDLRLTQAVGMTSFPSFAPTPSGFGLTFDDDRGAPGGMFYGPRQVFFATYASDASPTGVEVALTQVADGDARGARLVPAGPEFGIVYEIASASGGETGIRFLRVAADGTIISGPTTVAQGFYHSPSLAWTGTGYGVAYAGRADQADDGDVWMASLDSEGQPVGSPTAVTDGTAGSFNLFPDIVFDGAAFGFVWQDRRSDYLEIYFRKASADGTMVSDELRVTTAVDSVSSAVRVAWSGSDFLLAYSDSRNPPGQYQVYLARVAADGGSVVEDVQVSDAPGNADTPGIAVWQNRLWLSWVEKEHGGPDPFSPMANSPVIDAGLDLGMAFNGSAPDIGAIEYGNGFGIGDGPSEIHLAVLDMDLAPIDAMVVSSNDGFSAFPVLGPAGDGMTVAWFDTEGGEGRELYGARLLCEP